MGSIVPLQVLPFYHLCKILTTKLFFPGSALNRLGEPDPFWGILQLRTLRNPPPPIPNTHTKGRMGWENKIYETSLITASNGILIFQ